eukprot:7407718-Pyramimonas_sp.AAC.1
MAFCWSIMSLSWFLTVRGAIRGARSLCQLGGFADASGAAGGGGGAAAAALAADAAHLRIRRA